MSIRRLVFLCAAAALAALTCGEAARADLLIEVDKAAQRMTVTVDGHEVYKWAVATGGIDYDTPNGAFKPFRMEIDHHSDEWDNAPMPYSIFFTQTGNAVHGTYEQRSLGHAVSARLRATVAGQRRDAVGTGEAPKDGQYDRCRDGRYPGREAAAGSDCCSEACERERPFPSLPRTAGSLLPVPLAASRLGGRRTSAGDPSPSKNQTASVADFDDEPGLFPEMSSSR
jgi:hypothetical protein